MSQTLSGLDPQTTYFYKIVADNASGSTEDTADDIMSFTTQPDAAGACSRRSSDSVTDTTGTVDLTIDPERRGHERTSSSTATTTNYGQQTDPIDIGSGTDPVEKQLDDHLEPRPRTPTTTST